MERPDAPGKWRLHIMLTRVLQSIVPCFAVLKAVFKLALAESGTYLCASSIEIIRVITAIHFLSYIFFVFSEGFRQSMRLLKEEFHIFCIKSILCSWVAGVLDHQVSYQWRWLWKWVWHVVVLTYLQGYYEEQNAVTTRGGPYVSPRILWRTERRDSTWWSLRISQDIMKKQNAVTGSYFPSGN